MSTDPDLPPEMAFDFEAFARAQLPRLRSVAARRLRQLDDADEVAAETLLRAYQHRLAFRDADGAAAWCTTVAQRLCVDRLRIDGRTVSVPELPDSPVADVVVTAVARVDVQMALTTLRAMPARQARAVWARDVEGLSYAEIADRLAVPPTTVRALLHRGRRALRDDFNRRAGMLPTFAALGGAGEWLRRLLSHRAAPAVTGAALAVAAVTAAVLVAPGPHVDAPAVLGGPVPAAGVAADREPTALPVTARSDVAAPASAGTHSVPDGSRVLPALPPACAAGACVYRTSAPPGTRLVIGFDVPGTDLHRVGISTDVISGCAGLATNPPVTCESQESR